MGSTADMSWDDIKPLFRETDRKFQETDRKFQKTRELIDRLSREISRDLKKLDEKLGGLGDKFVYFTEGMALPSMERLLRKRFGMTNVSPRHRLHNGGREQEYDVLAWAKGTVNRAVVVEVKSQIKKRFNRASHQADRSLARTGTRADKQGKAGDPGGGRLGCRCDEGSSIARAVHRSDTR